MQLLLREMENLARTRYANGLAPQQDALKAQAEQTALRTSRITWETEQRQTRAHLNALLAARPRRRWRSRAPCRNCPAPPSWPAWNNGSGKGNPTLLAQSPRLRPPNRPGA